jgi:PKD repeat protein
MSFGDKKKATQRGDDATGIFHHTYPKAGTYTARVSITDNAGNSTSATAKVHVTTDLPPAVRGALPASVPKGRAASGRITASAPGYLSVQLLGASGQVLQHKVLHFAKGGAKATLSFPTTKLAKGRYLTVWHFTGLDGWAGPVVTRNLRVR